MPIIKLNKNNAYWEISIGYKIGLSIFYYKIGDPEIGINVTIADRPFFHVAICCWKFVIGIAIEKI